MNQENTEQAGFSIGVAARMTGINTHTLRMWERRYQLGPSKRKGNRREYTTTDIDHLKLIKKLVDNGMRIGDIAQLPRKTLTSLLLERGGESTPQEPQHSMRAIVAGVTLCEYFKQHLKRYPKLQLELHNVDAEEWLAAYTGTENALYFLQFGTLGQKHIKSLLAISDEKRQTIVCYHYATRESVEALERAGVVLIRGAIETAHMDTAVNKALRLSESFSILEQAGHQFDITLPASQPRQFDEHHLVEAEKQANKLNCECPPHLTDLIRRLNAFEDYSKTCGAENWKQAAVHACIYTYTNQARFFIEKALRAVLDE